MQLQQSQLGESASQARQPVLPACQPASQSSSPQSHESAQFLPTTCSCSRVSPTSQLATQASQPVLSASHPVSQQASKPASQPAHDLPRAPTFLQQHAVAAKSDQRVSWPSRPGSLFCQPASQQASQPASPESIKSVKFLPTTCSCSKVSSASQPTRLASQFCQPSSQQASQPAHNLPRVPSFLQQHAVAAASASKPASQRTISQECQVSSNNMQLQPSQLNESAGHPGQAASSAIQPARSQSTNSDKFPPTTCSCSQVSSTSQQARLASQFCQPDSQPTVPQECPVSSNNMQLQLR